MNSIQSFRVLAWVNLVAGIMGGLSVVVGATSAAMKNEITLVRAIFIAVFLVVAYSLVSSALKESLVHGE
jgi:nicotinamide riboside transporter PnuC